MMQKAYDPKLLLEKLKAQGLDLAEDALEALVKGTFAWLTESAALSPTPFDNVAAVIYPEVEKVALSLIDKIDGSVG